MLAMLAKVGHITMLAMLAKVAKVAKARTVGVGRWFWQYPFPPAGWVLGILEMVYLEFGFCSS
jgi:hypothetical protein